MRRSLKINRSLLMGLLVAAQVATPGAGVVLKNTNLVYAQETVQDSYLYVQKEDGTLTIAGYTGTDTQISIGKAGCKCTGMLT